MLETFLHPEPEPKPESEPEPKLEPEPEPRAWSQFLFWSWQNDTVPAVPVQAPAPQRWSDVAIDSNVGKGCIPISE